MNSKVTPARLTHARVDMGLSQTDLAEASGVSRVTISKIENGVLLHPSVETMSSISWALRRPLDFFYPTGELRLRPSTIPSYRGMKTKSKTDMQKTQFRIDDCLLLIQYLFSIIRPRTTGLQFDELDSVESLSPAEVEGIAAEVREQFGLGQGRIRPLTTLLENNGIICMAADLPAKVDSVNVSVPMGEGKETVLILYKRSLNYYRQRFSLAHELGHVVLHHYVDAAEYDLHFKELEDQANRFASSFLMPGEAFYSTVRGISLNEALILKKRWDVSVSAIIRRLKDLSVIDDRRYEYLMKEMSRKKWRTKEPGDDNVLPEYPYYMRNAYDYVLKNGASTSDEILEYTGLSRREVVDLIGNNEWFIPIMPKNEFLPND